MGSNEKREKELDELAIRYGFVREGKYTKNGRIKYVKGRETVYGSPTNHDRRALLNLESEFKRKS